MESQHPSFRFMLEYADQTVDCQVLMQNDAYDITFDGRWMASVEHTDEWTWIQACGVILPAAVIEEIGYRIESEYK
jgi:hypothetical protein